MIYDFRRSSHYAPSYNKHSAGVLWSAHINVIIAVLFLILAGQLRTVPDTWGGVLLSVHIIIIIVILSLILRDKGGISALDTPDTKNLKPLFFFIILIFLISLIYIIFYLRNIIKFSVQVSIPPPPVFFFSFRYYSVYSIAQNERWAVLVMPLKKISLNFILSYKHYNCGSIAYIHRTPTDSAGHLMGVR